MELLLSSKQNETVSSANSLTLYWANPASLCMCKFSGNLGGHKRIKLTRNLVGEMACRTEEKEGEGGEAGL